MSLFDIFKKKDVKVTVERKVVTGIEYEELCEKADIDGTLITLELPNGGKMIRTPKERFIDDRQRRLSKYIF